MTNMIKISRSRNQFRSSTVQPTNRNDNSLIVTEQNENIKTKIIYPLGVLLCPSLIENFRLLLTVGFSTS